MNRRVTDLRLVVGLVVAATIALLVPGVPWPLEWLFGLPLLLVVPGYAVIAALFPERPSQPLGGHESPGWPARMGLSLVGSVLVVAAVGILLARQGLVELTLAPAVLLLGVVTLLAAGIAAIRRARLPVEHRADPIAGVSAGAVTDAAETTGAQSAALLLAIVVLASALAVAGTAPAAQPHSEAYLTGGEGVDVGPGNATLVAGADNTVALAIANHERKPTDYEVVMRLQRVGANGTVLGQERLDEFGVGVAANETRVVERSLVPASTSDRARLQVLVYEGGIDTTVGPRTADLALRLWVTVTDGGAT